MAEIVRLQQRTETIHTRSDGVTEPNIASETTVVVRSIHGHDASVIRDFVRGLDAAAAPGTALIEAQHTPEGHLTGLVARWTERQPAKPGQDG